MKINIGKMRRYMARNTPDAVSRTFSYDDEYDYVKGYDEWCKSFAQRMSIKHGSNVKEITIHQSVTEPAGSVRVQLVVSLYDPRIAKRGDDIQGRTSLVVRP